MNSATKGVEIRLEGFLDRSGVRRLTGRLEQEMGRGVNRFLLDLGSVRSVLHEGVEELHRFRRREDLPGAIIEISGIPEGALELFRLMGFPHPLNGVIRCEISNLQDRSDREKEHPFHQRDIPEPGPGRSRDRFLCLGCRKTVRVESVGLYSCPHCGAKFHASGPGRATFYESLRKF